MFTKNIKIHQTYLIAIIFLLTKSILIFYIINYTVRERNPVWCYFNDEEITCFDISNSGVRALVLGSLMDQ
jgi:hypothetical protein